RTRKADGGSRNNIGRVSDNMAEKVHVLKDETLGGVKREYVEVERKAEVGDLVRIYEYADDFEDFIGRIDRVDSCNDLITYGHYNNRSDDRRDITEGSDKCAVLEPTDIVIIGGKRYRIEERLAEPGELILRKKNGLTYDVKDVAGDFIIVGDSQLFLEEDYVVLKRVDAPQSQDDIIANLVRRVMDLERKNERLETELTDAKSDIETWAQEVETIKHTMGLLEKDVDGLYMDVSKPKQITLDIDTLAK